MKKFFPKLHSSHVVNSFIPTKDTNVITVPETLEDAPGHIEPTHIEIDQAIQVKKKNKIKTIEYKIYPDEEE